MRARVFSQGLGYGGMGLAGTSMGSSTENLNLESTFPWVEGIYLQETRIKKNIYVYVYVYMYMYMYM